LNREFPAEAVEFAAAVRGALGRIGGTDLARRAEADPSIRRTELRPVLDDLGFLGLAPLEGEIELAAAALGLREAGALACPWPLVQQLAVPIGLAAGNDAVYIGTTDTRRLAHLDVVERPLLFTIEGAGFEPIADSTTPSPVRLDPFGVACRLAPGPVETPGLPELYFILDAFYILGGLRTVLAMTAEYAGQRRQFGRPIGRFGAARWRLSDMAVATAGLEELAAYTLWRRMEGGVSASDAMALRYLALDSAALILHEGHQLFAAIGLCDEHDLALLDRHLQPQLRRPFGLVEANRQLSVGLDRHGFDALFPIQERTFAAAEN
jgi:hypothetical protein